MDDADAAVLAGQHCVEVGIAGDVSHDQVVDAISRYEEVCLSPTIIEVIDIFTSSPNT